MELSGHRTANIIRNRRSRESYENAFFFLFHKGNIKNLLFYHFISLCKCRVSYERVARLIHSTRTFIKYYVFKSLLSLSLDLLNGTKTDIYI